MSEYRSTVHKGMMERAPQSAAMACATSKLIRVAICFEASVTMNRIDPLIFYFFLSSLSFKILQNYTDTGLFVFSRSEARSSQEANGYWCQKCA